MVKCQSTRVYQGQRDSLSRKTSKPRVKNRPEHPPTEANDSKKTWVSGIFIVTRFAAVGNIISSSKLVT